MKLQFSKLESFLSFCRELHLTKLVLCLMSFILSLASIFKGAKFTFINAFSSEPEVGKGVSEIGDVFVLTILCGLPVSGSSSPFNPAGLSCTADLDLSGGTEEQGELGEGINPSSASLIATKDCNSF